MSTIDRFNDLFTGDEATLSGDSVVVVELLRLLPVPVVDLPLGYDYRRWRIPVDAFDRGMVAAELALARAVDAERVADPGEPTEDPARVAWLAFFDEVGEDAADAPLLTFACWDGHGDEEEVLAETAEGAAQVYVDGVTWGDGTSTVFVDVMTAEVGEAASVAEAIARAVKPVTADFPPWLAPVQARVLPVSEKFRDYGDRVVEQLRDAGLRAQLDHSDEKLGYKIRRAELDKVPYALIVGAREVEAEAVEAWSRALSVLAQTPHDFILQLEYEKEEDEEEETEEEEE